MDTSAYSIFHIKKYFQLDFGADLVAKDMNGSTPMMYAATEGHDAIMELFCYRGNAWEQVRDLVPFLFCHFKIAATVAEMINFPCSSHCANCFVNKIHQTFLTIYTVDIIDLLSKAEDVTV